MVAIPAQCHTASAGSGNDKMIHSVWQGRIDAGTYHAFYGTWRKVGKTPSTPRPFYAVMKKQT
jgi:hypothetical protein